MLQYPEITVTGDYQNLMAYPENPKESAKK